MPKNQKNGDAREPLSFTVADVGKIDPAIILNYYRWKYKNGVIPPEDAEVYQLITKSDNLYNSRDVQERKKIFRELFQICSQRANRLGQTSPTWAITAVDESIDELKNGIDPIRAVVSASLQVGACGVVQALDPPLGLDLDADKARAWLESMRDTLAPERTNNAKPTAQNGRDKTAGKRRKRSGNRKLVITPRQAEAVQIVGEHKGNVTAAAMQMGKSRQAVSKLYKKGLEKAPAGYEKKIRSAQGLPTDRRGQNLVVDED